MSAKSEPMQECPRCDGTGRVEELNSFGEVVAEHDCPDCSVPPAPREPGVDAVESNVNPMTFGEPDFTRPLARDEAWAIWWGRSYMRLVKRPEDFKTHPPERMWAARGGDGLRVVRVRLVPALRVPAAPALESFTEAEWEGLVFSLSGRAEFLAARYGAPVYLVGSALNWREKPPNDIDIRIVLPDADWEARFGGNSLHFNAECSPAYVAEVGKMTRQLVRDLRRNIDLQVQPENWLTRHNAHAKPRLLLADCPAAPVSGEPCRDCCVVGGHLFNCARYAEGFENAFIAWERTLPPNELYVAGPNATDTAAAPSGGSEVSEAEVEAFVRGFDSTALSEDLAALPHAFLPAVRAGLTAALRAGGPTP